MKEWSFLCKSKVWAAAEVLEKGTDLFLAVAVAE